MRVPFRQGKGQKQLRDNRGRAKLPVQDITDVVAIFGPTAVGKSRVAVEVARALKGEIVSADSMQVYRGLPIITDQPSPEMLAALSHHLVGTVGLEEEYSAGRFASEAAAMIIDIKTRGKLPLLIGGTGLYMRSLLGGFSFGGRSDGARKKWQNFIREEGVEAGYRELSRLDPEAASTVDRENPRRLIRALEAAEAATAGAGEPLSVERERLWSADSPYRGISFGLMAPRSDLYRRIDERVDQMLDAGAVREVQEARQKVVSATAAQAIGFREISGFLDGLMSLEEAAAAIKQKSRRYAKRQLTWTRKMPDIVRIDLAGRSPATAAAAIIEHIHDASA
ncbi:MAG: tRNA (adenosine(37)-N6)-dimethylallyltransferase MiaA [Thermoleophilia bacterium]|nr:tRNA (adenosine(37)-N6)-dimethylallyltransferase MiaA [Thermoleophilia bacterium]